MSKLLQLQMDYIFFVYGLSFIFLAAMCLVLRARDRSLPWGLLAAFGVTHGVNEWLDMVALSLGDSPSFKAVRVCVMALSFCFLVEFGRLGTRSVTGKGPGRWITALLLAVGCAGWSFGWVGLNVFFRYALGFVGGMWSVLAFVTASRCVGKRDERHLLLALGSVFAAYAVVGGLIVPKALFLPASLLNHDSFLRVFGFPVQLLRGLLAAASAICVWQLLHVRETFLRRAYAPVFMVSVLVLVAGGWCFVNRTDAAAERKAKDSLLSTCQVLASSIAPMVADEELGSVGDAHNTRDQFMRARFVAIIQSAPEYRSVYLMSRKDDRIIFAADSDPTTSKGRTLVRSVYSDVPELLRAVFRRERQSAVAEYEDRWGKWVSAFVPIRNKTTGKTVAVLGVDRSHDAFRRVINRERLAPIVTTLLVLVLMIVFLAAYERQRVSMERISASERTLRESEARSDQLAEHSRTVVWEVDAQGLFTYVSHVSETVWGYRGDELAGRMHFYDLHPEAGREAFRKAAFAVFARKEPFQNLENATQTKDDSVVWVSTNGIPLLRADGTLQGYRGSDTEITERKRAEEALRESEEQYRVIFEGSAHGILITDSETRRFMYANPSICRMLGYTESELLQLGVADIHPKETLGQLKSDMDSLARGEKPMANAVLSCLRKDGTVLYAEVTPALTKRGERECIVGFFADVTERKRATEKLLYAKVETEAVNHQLEDALLVSKDRAAAVEVAKDQIEENAIELRHQADHDALTGLPNRQRFEQRLNDLVVGSAGKKSRSMAVLFLDLDKFKLINNTLGHKIGDLLLVEVAGRLQSCLRSQDVLARMGGDEFTVFLPRCRSRSIAQSLASRMIDSVSCPFEIEGHRFVIGASVGLASYPSDGADAVTLLKHADAAMYKAKQSGRGTYRWYSGDVDVDNQQRVEMEMDIRTALEKGQFHVYYQPIVGLEDGNILAAEALLRWEHPEKGMISPSLFIPIAEEIGVIGQIGDYVLRTACAQTMAWRGEGIYLSQIAVNVSTRQIRDASWLDSVGATLSDTGLDARCLDLEVTETDFSADYELMRETLQEVQKLGICLSIDDFGMGQSSLSRLKDFPVIHLKIDGSFVRDIEYNKDDSALVRSIVELAHGQCMNVTAEWVETESQMEILRSIGCDFAQGYFISPALPAEAFGDFFRDWKFAQGEAAAA